MMKKLNIDCPKIVGDKIVDCPWIMISGMDGSGKTNLKQELAKDFRGAGLRVKDFHSPYQSFVRPALDVSGGGQTLFRPLYRPHDFRA